MDNNYYEIDLDIWKQYPTQIISVKQLDTGRKIRINLYSNGYKLNVSNSKVTVYIKKNNKKIIFNNCKIINTNIIEMEINSNIVEESGEYNVEIDIISEGISTFNFILNVVKTNKDITQITQTSQYQALVDAFKEISDIDKNFNDIEEKILNKADKDTIWTMANMGQDVKEAMTGGSVAVIGRNTILEENIVNNQVTPDKISFTKWENEEILFDEKSSFEKNIVLTNSKDAEGKDVFQVTYKTDDEIIEHNYYTALVPINPNSLISIEFKNNNKCRIGIAFSGQIDENGKITRAAKIIKNDDSVTNIKIEATNATGIYLIAYLGYDTEQIPSLIVKSRPQGSKIIFEDVSIKELDENIKISPSQTTFIEAMQIKTINRGVLSKEGKYYYKDTTQEDYSLYNLFLINTEDIDILKDFQIFNAGDCIRIMGHNGYNFNTFEAAIKNLLIQQGDTFNGEKILFSDTTIIPIQDIDVSKYSMISVYVGKNVKELDSSITKKSLKDIEVNFKDIKDTNIEEINSQLNDWQYVSKEILAEKDGKLFAYLSDNESTKYCIHLSLENYANYNIKAENINRCRIALFKKDIKNITFVKSYSEYRMYADKILANDDTLSNIDATFNSEEYKTCIIYLGMEVADSNIVPNVEIKYSIANITIPKLKINKKQLAFNFDNEVKQIINNGISLDNSINDINVIYEFPKASDEWVTDSSNKKLDITTNQFLEMFYDKWLGYHIEDGLRVNKKSLGKDTSGQYDIYEYDFIPPHYTETILLSSGMHAYELSASFGLAHFFTEYMKYPYASDGFKYLRENVRIKVIPVVNPWGFNHTPYKTYGNSNGVNPNRNFDSLDENGQSVWDSFPIYSPNKSDSNYNEWNVKGEAPFSESETIILRDWVLDNSNAKFWIDCHTGLGYGKYDNWIVTVSTNKNLNKIYYALYELEKRIENVYSTTSRTNKDIDGETAIKHKWCCNVAKVPCMTIEQAPENTLWGTKLNNESGDITEYATTVYAYVIAQLKDM